MRVRGGEEEKRRTLEELAGQGVAAEPAPYVPDAYYLKGFDRIEQLKPFREGRLQVQDVSSMLAAEAAAPKKGSRILDLCAAPGGKSIYLADLAGEDSLVISRDLIPSKVQRIRENAERCGLDRLRTEQWDACETDPEMIEKSGYRAGGRPLLRVRGHRQEAGY